MVRDLRATTTASTFASTGGAPASGTPLSCTTRIPARTRLLARSVAPVKSSAMQPSFIVPPRLRLAPRRCPARGRSRLGTTRRRSGSFLRARQLDSGKDLDHRGIVFLGEAGGRGLHEHLVRGAGQGQGKLRRAGGIE